MAENTKNDYLVDWYKFITMTEVERHLLLSLISLVEVKMLASSDFNLASLGGCLPSWIYDCIDWKKFCALSHKDRELIGLNLTVLKGKFIVHEELANELTKILKTLHSIEGPIPDWFLGSTKEWLEEAEHFNFQNLLLSTTSELETLVNTLEMVNRLVSLMPKDTSERDEVLSSIHCNKVDLFEFARCNKQDRGHIIHIMRNIHIISEKFEYWHCTRVVEGTAKVKPIPQAPQAPKKRKQRTGQFVVSPSAKRKLFFGEELSCDESPISSSSEEQ